MKAATNDMKIKEKQDFKRTIRRGHSDPVQSRFSFFNHILLYILIKTKQVFRYMFGGFFFFTSHKVKIEIRRN